MNTSSGAVGDGAVRDGMRLVFVGWGAIARTAAGLLPKSSIDIVGVATRRSSEPRDVPPAARHLTHPDQLAEVAPTVVAEAAGRGSVQAWGAAALACGADFVVSSVSAFADTAVLDSLRRTAEASGGRIEIQPGAVAGVQALHAARYLGLDSVVHRIVKPPAAWSSTAAETMCALDELNEPAVFFTGPADQAAAAFPSNANVAMTTALAGIGPAKTRIELVADPLATMNRHELFATGAFGDLSVAINNRPLAENPKTSAMAALSLARTIENRISVISV